MISARAGWGATYRLCPQKRDWLTAGEAAELRGLLTAFTRAKDTLPHCVFHAVNLSEDAMRLGYWDRFPLFPGIGLEGLIRAGNARLFRERLPRLGDDVGIDGVDE
ncbi:MAG: hypothetical protein OXG37_06225 [Actinomycetia bacterium]|nr:hypothetical protein [Actinomycetes bacterium]